MRQYHDLLRRILETGVEKPTRAKLESTGENISAISRFGDQIRFDLREGFPLVTTKKVAFRLIAEELFWFLRGETNVRSLHLRGVHLWDPWILQESEVGGLSENRPLVFIERRDREYVPGPENLSGHLRAAPRTRGGVDIQLRELWRRIMSRCYDSSHHRYSFYGGRGVFVAKAWHDLATFVRDVKQLPNWRHKVQAWQDYDLDKDYYGGKCYGPDTCVWLHQAENCCYRSVAKPFSVSRGGGPPQKFLALDHAVTFLGLPRSTAWRLAAGRQSPEVLRQKNKHARRWRFEPVVPPEGKLLRMALSSGELGPIYGAAWRRWPKADGGHVDQIADLVAGIEAVKRDPTDSRGRRLLVMAWDPRQLDKVALPPCHIYHQYSVTNGRLSCMFGMRSSDSVLGLPYNVASYALLTHLLAKITGLQVGELVASLADVHIYTNHLDLVYEQLSREPRSLPRLSISDDVRTLEDLSSLTYDQVRLADYNPWPALKGEVAV